MEYRIRELGAITPIDNDERVGNYAYYERGMLVENIATGKKEFDEDLPTAISKAFPDAEAIFGREGELIWAKEE